MKNTKLKFSEYIQNISRSKSFGKFVLIVYAQLYLPTYHICISRFDFYEFFYYIYLGDKTADKIYEAFSWAKHVILQKMELGWTKLFEGYETNQTAK